MSVTRQLMFEKLLEMSLEVFSSSRTILQKSCGTAHRILKSSPGKYNSRAHITYQRSHMEVLRSKRPTTKQQLSPVLDFSDIKLFCIPRRDSVRAKWPWGEIVKFSMIVSSLLLACLALGYATASR